LITEVPQRASTRQITKHVSARNERKAPCPDGMEHQEAAMNIAITFRQMDSTDAMKGYAHEKVGRLQKFLREPMKGQVKLSCQSRQHSAEVEIHAGARHYHAHETSEDMYASIDKVIDKLERQIRSTKASQKGKERTSQRLINDESGED
jgi:putative sigma-54 modulation protein